MSELYSTAITVGADELPHKYQEVATLSRQGVSPLTPAPSGISERKSLSIAVVIPPFMRGSGGHGTIFQTVRRLEEAGHNCSIWHYDPLGYQRSAWPAVIRAEIQEFFQPIKAPVFKGFDEWIGADVVMATGWQTVYPTLLLTNCYAKTYMVNDYEPTFYAASTESLWSEKTYSYDLHCISASPWLRDLLKKKHGRDGCAFQLGVDHSIYRPRETKREQETVVYYCRPSTPRRAAALAVLAFQELRKRRPSLRIILYGDKDPLWTTFDHEYVGVATPNQLAWLYSQATVGLSFSMTNFSLVPKEMLACGLPCVELAGVSAESIFGEDGPIELVDFNPIAVADGVERLLDDQALWQSRSVSGREFVASHTWEVATSQVEQGLREALKKREIEL